MLRSFSIDTFMLFLRSRRCLLFQDPKEFKSELHPCTVMSVRKNFDFKHVEYLDKCSDCHILRQLHRYLSEEQTSYYSSLSYFNVGRTTAAQQLKHTRRETRE
jgi:hypothetical protein